MPAARTSYPWLVRVLTSLLFGALVAFVLGAVIASATGFALWLGLLIAAVGCGAFALATGAFRSGS